MTAHSAAFKVIVLAAALSATGASAQSNDSPFAFFNRVFKGSGATDNNPPAQSPQGEAKQDQPQLAQNSQSDLIIRIDRLEAQIRQLTGTIEQLQYRNQQLEAQIARIQQQGAAVAPQANNVPPVARPPAAGNQPLPPLVGPGGQSAPPPGTAQNPPPLAPAGTGRRSDAFDPALNPNAPGAPQPLGSSGSASVPPNPAGEPGGQVGAPGGRVFGEPLDLTRLGSNQGAANPPPGGSQPPPGSAVADPGAAQPGTLPPPPTRNPSGTGAVAAVLPPTASPRDQYDLGYGYVLRKDYALAEDAFQTFLTRFPTDKLVPEAQFWLGESRFQRQRYDAAAEAFLTVSTKYPGNAKAPEAMLRLGQSLAALNQHDMACATLAEVSRKFPRASPVVKQGVQREQKRVKC